MLKKICEKGTILTGVELAHMLRKPLCFAMRDNGGKYMAYMVIFPKGEAYFAPYGNGWSHYYGQRKQTVSGWCDEFWDSDGFYMEFATEKQIRRAAAAKLERERL